MNSKTKKIFITLITIMFVVLFILSVMQKKAEVEDSVVENTVELHKTAVEKKEINRLLDMTERDRIEYYFSMFVREIEAEDYESAYSMLNKDFKANYFPTLIDFQLYVDEHFPSSISIEYENIERNGTTYILWLKMFNPLAVDKSNAKSMKVVVKENAVNDFELSFSADEEL